MKKFLYLLLFIGSICAAQNRPIITKWNAHDKKIEIGTDGAFSYTYQQVGSTNISSSYYVTGSTTINVPNAGEYIVSITPISTFRFRSTNSGSRDKFLELMQWGDVSWDTNLGGMFQRCTNLRITATDIPDFSNVTFMVGMFRECPNLGNIPNINSWNVSKVTDMSEMFYSATTFNSDVSAWDTSLVKNFKYMFYNTLFFNQNLNNWNVSSATNLDYMFEKAKSFNGNIGDWNVSNVTTMNRVFYSAVSFNQNIGNWNVSNVKSMLGLFAGAIQFNQNIKNWNVSKVENFASAFNTATAFNQNLNTWDVSNATSMSYMFANTLAFNQDIGDWNVSKVTTMDNIFSNAASFNQNLGNWNMEKVGTSSGFDLNQMFDNSGLSCENYALTLKGWAENSSTPRNLTLGAANVKYGQVGQNFRHFFTTQKGWKFNGDIFEPTCNDALATNENSLSEKLNFYPNPTTGKITYQSQTDEQVQITNIAGQLLKTVKVTKGTNQIDISEFPKGIYFLKAGIKTSKLLKN